MQAIEENEGLTTLRLSGNSMGVQAAQAIAGTLASRSHLRRALWSDMFVGRLRNEIPPALVCTLHLWITCVDMLVSKRTYGVYMYPLPLFNHRYTTRDISMIQSRIIAERA